MLLSISEQALNKIFIAWSCIVLYSPITKICKDDFPSPEGRNCSLYCIQRIFKFSQLYLNLVVVFFNIIHLITYLRTLCSVAVVFQVSNQKCPLWSRSFFNVKDFKSFLFQFYVFIVQISVNYNEYLRFHVNSSETQGGTLLLNLNSHFALIPTLISLTCKSVFANSTLIVKKIKVGFFFT